MLIVSIADQIIPPLMEELLPFLTKIKMGIFGWKMSRKIRQYKIGRVEADFKYHDVAINNKNAGIYIHSSLHVQSAFGKHLSSPVIKY